MRRFPDSWTTTLAKLGFKRRNKKRRSRQYGRQSRIEALEERQMLAADLDITRFYVPSAGSSSLKVDYSVQGDPASLPDAQVKIYRSFNGTTPWGSPLLTSNTFDPAGSGTITITADFTDFQQDYFLIAQIDVPDDNATNNTEVFEGGLFRNVDDWSLHYHAANSAVNDSITVISDEWGYGSFYRNGQLLAYDWIPGVHVRTHGGNDTISIDDGYGSPIELWGFGGAGDDFIYGGAADDVLYGGDGADTIRGFGGNDFIDGGSDGDWLYGDDGNDVIYGGIEDPLGSTDIGAGYGVGDSIYGGAGDDEIHGEEGNEEIYGGAGNDEIYGGDDYDYILGEAGDDFIDGGEYADTIYGGDGNDELYAGGTYGGGTDYLDGGADNDFLSGENSTAQLYGQAGNDSLLAGGTGSLFGGADNDTYIIRDQFGGNISVTDTGGVDTLDFSQWNHSSGVEVVYGFAPSASLSQTVSRPENPAQVRLSQAAGTLIENVIGSGFVDTLIAPGTPLVVTTLADENESLAVPGHGFMDFSLREALALAAIIPGTDTITFDPSLYLYSGGGATVDLSAALGPLVINSSVVIEGPGADLLTIDAQGAANVFNITSGGATSVTVRGLALTGASSAGVRAQAGGGTTTLDGVEVLGNQGGGVSAWGTLYVTNSTIAENAGGTALAFNYGSAFLTNVTVSGNTSTSNAAGISVGSGSATLNHVTVTNNTADVNNLYSGGSGGLYMAGYAGITAHNSIIANNWVIDGGVPVAANAFLFNPYGSIGGTYNLVGANSPGFTTGNNNIIVTDPAAVGLAPLANYGGRTRTHALLDGSPALDAGNPSAVAGTGGVPLYDQRGIGFDRVVDGNGDSAARLDIGALEWNKPVLEVDTLVDENDGDYGPGDLSLREALALAAVIPGTDTITFTSSVAASGLITLTYDGPDAGTAIDPLSVNSAVTISGPGADVLTIDANQANSVFTLSTTATLQGLKLTGASANAVVASGAITIDEMEITGSGGGISFTGGALTISNSTIAENQGTGVYLAVGSANLTNTTISGNESAGDGGGVYVAYHGSNPVTLTNVTVTNNRAYKNSTTSPSTAGGGIFAEPEATITVNNTIVAGNFARTPQSQIASDVGTGFDGLYSAEFYANYSLLGVIAGLGFGGGANNIFLGGSGNPGLAPLGDYGGPTRTHALLPTSPAIDKGSDSIAASAGLAFDQRGSGFKRQVNMPGVGTSTVDIGAFEAPWRFDEDGGTPTNRGSILVEDAFAKITEGDSSVTEASRLVDITGSTLRLSFRDLIFDGADFADGDAFEFALLDENGNSLVATLAAGEDAFFRITEAGATELAPGITYGMGVVAIDTSQIPTGTRAEIVARLVNADSDANSMVRVALEAPRFDLWGVGNQPRQMVDVFLLFDDTGSFHNYTSAVGTAFQQIISALTSSFADIDFGFGVGRFEDYPQVSNGNDLPFILNQPIIADSTLDFQQSIEAALSIARRAPGLGHDAPESIIEALYQVGTGLGYDENGGGIGAGPLGALSTQLNNPNAFGDVPAFSLAAFESFPNEPHYILPPQGTLGGAGFREGSLPIVIVATDNGTKFRPEDAPIDYIVGVDEILVPYNDFVVGGLARNTSGREAQIQATIDSLVERGALVVGLGTTGSPTTAPRRLLEAIANATGAVSASASDIPSGITDDPISFGDPLYFQITTQSVPSGVSSAISAAISAGASTGELFRYTGDYTAPDAGYQNFGQIHYFDPEEGPSGEWKPVGSGISDMTVAPDGFAYLAVNKSLNDIDGPLLLKVDLNEVIARSELPIPPEILAEAEIVGTIAIPAGQFDPNADRVTGLAYDPAADRLYALLRDADATDRLYVINRQTGALVDDLGPIDGMVNGQSLAVEFGESLTVDADGTLIVTDDDNDLVGQSRHVYRLNPTTGEIVALVDGDVATSHELTGLTVDPETRALIASNTQGNASTLVGVTLGSAINPDLRDMLAADGITDVESLAFVTPLYGTIAATVIAEDSRLVTRDTDPSVGGAATTFTVTAGADAIRVGFSNLVFDAAGNAGNRDINDAFEIAILNPVTGKPLLGSIDSSSDAVFNITQGQSPVWAAGVELLDVAGELVSDPGAGVTAGFVQIDVSALAAGTEIQIVARLVNNDADDTTNVTIDLTPPMQGMYAMVGSGAARLLPTALNESNENPPGVRFHLLHDVSSAFDVAYTHTTYNTQDTPGPQNPTDPGQLTSHLTLAKLPSQLMVRGDLLLAVKPPLDQETGQFAGTQFLNVDGRLPYAVAGLSAGTPFVRLSNLLPSQNGFYLSGPSEGPVELVFQHPDNDRFDFELVVLGELNEAPSFVSDPYADVRGQAYPIDVFPTAEGAPVPMLEIVAQNGNELRYTPATQDPNNDRVRLEIVSGPATIEDTDANGFGGTIAWQPATADAGVHHIVVRAIDEFGALDPAHDQEFVLRVVASSFNRPPYFTTDPITSAKFGDTYEYPANAFDPDGHDLEYTGTLGAYPVQYEIPIGEHLPEGWMDYLTLVNEVSAPDAVGTFSNIRIYEAGGAADAQVRKFSANRLDVNYGAGGPGTAQVLGDGSVIRLTGDAQKAYQLDTPYFVTANTVLAFTFASESEPGGNAHGIGLDNQTSTRNDARWFQVYGTQPLSTVQDFVNYDPDWPVDQSENFTVDPQSGKVTWENIPAEVIGQWVHIDLKATETTTGEMYEAVQPYELLVGPGDRPPIQIGDVDLTIADISISGVTYDTQQRFLEGVITSTITNLGAGLVNGPLQVTFFEDLDFDGAYSPGQDPILGTADVEQPIAAGSTIAVSATVSGQVQYAGAIIWGFVDSSDVIDETNESNNVAASNADCLVVPTGLFAPEYRTLTEDPVIISPVVMDIGGDSIPEIIYSSGDPSELEADLYAVNGATGELLWNAGITINRVSEIAAGDLDGDGNIEIVAIEGTGFSARPVVLTIDRTTGQIIGIVANSEYLSSHIVVDDIESNQSRPVFAPALANVDGAAEPDAEIIIGSDVFDYFFDGSQFVVTKREQPNLVVSSSGSNDWGPISTVVDLDDDGTAEILVGNAAIHADGTTVWHTTSWVNDLGQLEDVYDGFTGVADFDGDELPEVVLVSQGKVYLLNGQTGVVIWSTPFPIQGNTNFGTGELGGAPTIADMTGDGFLEIGVAGSSQYMILDRFGDVRWTFTTRDASSGATGSSVFDFDGDGKAEIVYGDELALRIYSVPEEETEPELAVRYELLRVSGTAFELPVIADVDGDGNAEVLVVANTPATFNFPPGYEPELFNGLYVLEDAYDTWVPTRPLWNQHSYHITNVNNDGSIPVDETPSWLSHNTYRLNNLPDINPLSAPDLIPSFIRVSQEGPATTYTVRVGNSGSSFAPAGVQVDFYDGDPANGGTLIDSATTSAQMDPGRFEDVSITSVGPPLDGSELWIVVDPVEPQKPFGMVRECHEDNNIFNLETGHIYNSERGFVPDAVNNDPTIDSSPINIVVEGEPYYYDVDASDVDPGQSDQLKFSLPLRPAGMWIDAGTGEISWNPTLQQLEQRRHSVVVRVEDGHGGKATQWFNIDLISDNVDPVIDLPANLDPCLLFPEGDAPPITWAEVGVPWSYDVVATDANGDNPLFYELVVLSGFEAIDEVPTIDEFGHIAWSNPPREGNFAILVIVRDGRGGVDKAVFTIPVIDANTPPDFVSNGPIAPVVLNELWSYRFLADDLEDGPSTEPDSPLRFSIDAAARARGMNIDPLSGELTWTPMTEDTVIVFVGVTDSGDLTRQIQLTLPVNVRTAPLGANEPPKFESEPKGAATRGRKWSYLIQVSDLDQHNIDLTSVNITDGNGAPVTSGYTVSTLRDDPGKLVALLEFTPSFDFVGPAHFEITATDEGMAGRTQIFELSVVSNSAPLILSGVASAGAVRGAENEEPYEFTVIDYEGDNVGLEVISPAPGVGRFTSDPEGNNPITRLTPASSDPGAPSTFYFWFTPESEGPQQVKLRLTDSGGKRTEHTIDLDVVDLNNSPPDVSLRVPTTVFLGQTLDVRVEGDNPDIDGDHLSYYLLDDRGVRVTQLTNRTAGGGRVPAGMTIDSQNGRITWTPQPEQVTEIGGTPFTFTVLVTDGRYEFSLGPAEVRVAQPPTTEKPPFIVGTLASARIPAGESFDLPIDVIDFGRDGVGVEQLDFSVDGMPVGWSYSFSPPSISDPSTDPDDPDRTVLTFTPIGAGNYSFTIVVTDQDAHTAEHTFQLEVFNPANPNSLPGGRLEARDTAAVGELYVGQVTGHDPDADDTPEFHFLVDDSGTLQYVDEIDTLTFGGGLVPQGMAIDPASGRITWTPTADQLSQPSAAPYSYAVVVDDNSDPNDGFTQLGPIEVIVVSTLSNTPPRITSSPEGIRASGGQPLVYQATAEDDENDPITWQLVSGPATASIDQNGRFVWNPGPDELGTTQTAVIRVSDPYGPGQSQGITLQSSVTHIPGNSAPRIISTPTQPGVGGETYSYLVRARDDDGDRITLSLEGADLSGTSFTNFGDGTALFTWTPPTQGATRTFAFVATDSKELSSRQTIILTIGEQGGSTQTRVDTPPTFLNKPPHIIAEGDQYFHQVAATDPDATPAAPLTYSLVATRLDAEGNDTGVHVEDLESAIQSATGLIDWQTENGDEGAIRVSIRAEQAGTAAIRTFTLYVIDATGNNEPILEPADYVAAPGQSFAANIPGFDPDGQPVEFFLVAADDSLVKTLDGMTIDAGGRVTWQVPVDISPDSDRVFTVAVQDAGGMSAQRTYTIDIVEDQPPSVGVNVSTRRPEAGETVEIGVVATDDVGIVDIRLVVTWDAGSQSQDVLVSQNGSAQFTIPATADPGDEFIITATAIDSANQSVEAVVTLTVRPENTAQPQIEISSPEGGLVYETATEIKGRIYDNDNNLVFYSITATPSGGGAPITLLQESADPGTFLDNIDTLSTLAVLSPFALANETYQIDIVARDDAGEVAEVSFLVGIESEAKLGNFALTFTDLSVSVGGLPISVERRYDSLDADTKGEFGYGWSVEVLTGQLEYLRAGDVFDDFKDFLGYDQAITGGSRITLTLPGGEVHGFTAVPIPIDDASVIGGEVAAILGFANIFALAFQPDPGQGSRLDFFGGDTTPYLYPAGPILDELPVYLGNQTYNSLPVIYNEATGEFNMVVTGGLTAGPPANFSTIGGNLRLVTRDLDEYEFDYATGKLLRSEDFYGTKVEYSDDRIVATNGNDELGRLTITRENGLVRRIEDPNGNAVEYQYDAEGKLIGFWDRVATAAKASNPATPATATYGYGETEYSDSEVDVPPRVLTSIQNALGLSTLTIGWDDDGRLQKIGDAGDNEADFNYTVDAGTIHASLAGHSIETVSDANDAPAELVRDARGNLVRRIQRIEDVGGDGVLGNDRFQVTIFTYDHRDRLTGQTKAFMVDEATVAGQDNRYFDLPPGVSVLTPDPDDSNFVAAAWDSVQTFDGDGNLSVQVDGAGNETRYFDYDERGNPGRIVDPLENESINYFLDGQLSTVIDAAGGESSFGYGLGNLTSVTQIGDGNKQITTIFEYGDRRRLTSTTGPDGVTRYFIYDDAGNQTLSASYWDDPNGLGGNGFTGDGTPDVLLVNRTFYDENDRATRSAQYTLDPADWTVDPAKYAAAATLTDAAQLDTPATPPDWTTETHYNAIGQVERTVDRLGTETLNFYDERGNLVETRTESKYTGSPTVVWIVTRTAYDTNGRAEYTVDPHVEGNPDGPPASAPGTQTVYDDLGRVVETRRYDSVLITLQNHATAAGVKELVSASANNLRSSSQTYFDAAGRVEFTVDPAGLITKFEYDDAERQEKVTQYLSGTLNPASRVVEGIADPINDVLVTETMYDFAGRVERTIDAKDVETTYQYDGVGRLTSTVADDGGLNVTTITHYDKLGRKDYEIDSLNRRTDYEYDDDGRLTAVILPEVDNPTGSGPARVRPRYEYVYDQYGNQVLIRDPMDDDFSVGTVNKETRFTYDHLGRQTGRTLPLGVATPLDPNDFVERAVYNPLGQQTLAIDFEGRHTAFEYDEFGRLSNKKYYADAATYANGTGTPDETATYSYDGLGRIVANGDGLLGYDAEGRLTYIESGQGIIHYEYDSVGRLKRTWTEELSGSPSPISDTRYTYDRLSRLKTVNVDARLGFLVGTPLYTEYFYDKVGNLQRTVGGYAHLVASRYEYDNLNRLTFLEQFLDGNQNGTFDVALGEELISSYGYTVRADGKRTQAIEKNELGEQTTIDWVYDELGRLTEERHNAPGTASDFIAKYGYDLATNRVSLEKDAANANPASSTVDEAIAYLYDANDRLLVEQLDNTGDGVADRTTLYEYGPNFDFGNLSDPDGGDWTVQTKKSVYQNATGTGTPSEIDLNTYNLQGRLQQVDLNEDGVGPVERTFTYKYNDAGIRVEQTEQAGGGPATRTLFHVDPNNPTGLAQVLEEGVDTDGNLMLSADELTRAYTLGLTVLEQTDADYSYPGGEPPYYIDEATSQLLADGHGSVRAFYNINGFVLERYAYDAYGNMLAGPGLTLAADAATRLLYSGQQTDPTGLQYLRARYYDPATGRFNRLDPFAGFIEDPLSLHRYLYALANPIGLIDPTGLASLVESLSVTNIQNMLSNIVFPAIKQVAKQVAKKIGCEIGEYLAFEGIYVFIANGAFYVGQSTNVARRLAEHKRDFGKAFEGVAAVLEFVPGLDKERANKFVRELVEQVFLDGLEGLPSANTNNPISPRNAAKRLSRHLGTLTKAQFKEIFGKVADKFKICEKIGGKPSLVDFVF